MKNYSRKDSSDERIVIRGASMLVGPELDYVRRGTIEISGGLISSVETLDSDHNLQSYGESKKRQKITKNDLNSKSFDGSGLLIIPAFVNAHTHLGDSIGKDISASAGLDARVNPVFGIKKKILENTPASQLKAFIRFSAISMLKKGIVTFADFREGGRNGVLLLREAIANLPIRCIALGRTERYSTNLNNTHTGSHMKDGSITASETNQIGSTSDLENEIDEVLQVSDGLGLSGANENTDEMLAMYRKRANKAKTNEGRKKVAIHAAESEQSVAFSRTETSKTELERIMPTLEPDILVHMTNATDAELVQSSQSGIGIVVCPRANGVLGVGVPRISAMIGHGCLLGLGTDNVMLNSPDMFREMDFAWKASRATERSNKMLEARDVMKMATVNGAKILGIDTGCIATGKIADLVFLDTNHIDISPMHDPYSAIVQRATPDSIKAVMAGGKLVELISDGL